MGMRVEQDPSKIKVKVGKSENRDIVLFRSVVRKKNLYQRDTRIEDVNNEYNEIDFDNPQLLKEIVRGVKSDFVKKCITLLETCTTMPDSLYTYDVFNKMFSIPQEGDNTTGDKVYKFTISDQSDIEDIVDRIVQGYIKRNAKFRVDDDTAGDLVITDLLVTPTSSGTSHKDLVHKMFGGGEFPFLSVRYAWHSGRNEWVYVYNITR